MLQASLALETPWPITTGVDAARRQGVERDRGAGLVGRADEVRLDDIGDIVGVRCTGIAGRVELAGDDERYVGDVRGVGDRRVNPS